MTGIMDTNLGERKQTSSRVREDEKVGVPKNLRFPTTSEIPDLFFDQIIVEFRLNRVEILVLMHIYRLVWCKPNLYKTYGISGLMNENELARGMGLKRDEFFSSIKSLELNGFITVMRPGQFFVRKYFTQENDFIYGQNYDDFEP
jgi:DNA-binding MarR family transcriptional regulator